MDGYSDLKPFHMFCNWRALRKKYPVSLALSLDRPTVNQKCHLILLALNLPAEDRHTLRHFIVYRLKPVPYLMKLVLTISFVACIISS